MTAIPQAAAGACGCPFCGSSDLLLESDSSGLTTWRVMCQNDACEADGPHALTAEGAVEAWNTRAPGIPGFTRQEVLAAMFKPRRFFWGTVAIFALRRHYAREVPNYAAKAGYSREAIREAAHRALDSHFDAAWPNPARNGATTGSRTTTREPVVALRAAKNERDTYHE